MTKAMPTGGARLCLTACVLVFLTACASKTEVVTVPQVVRVVPPEVWLLETPEPELYGNTNGALEDLARNALLQLRTCNHDKESLRKWAAGVE